VAHATRRRQVKLIGFVLFIVMLGGGLLLGTQSSLTLDRNASGSVTAVNAWRFAGVPLISRSVTGLREVRLVPMNLSTRDERSSANHDFWGRRVIPERVVLVGDSQLEYPYREDVSLIRSFLTNPRNNRVQLTQPLDVRRKAASFVLLTLAALTVDRRCVAAGGGPRSAQRRAAESPAAAPCDRPRRLRRRHRRAVLVLRRGTSHLRSSRAEEGRGAPASGKP
jgi:hypothetical protein